MGLLLHHPQQCGEPLSFLPEVEGLEGLSLISLGIYSPRDPNLNSQAAVGDDASSMQEAMQRMARAVEQDLVETLTMQVGGTGTRVDKPHRLTAWGTQGAYRPGRGCRGRWRSGCSSWCRMLGTCHASTAQRSCPSST